MNSVAQWLGYAVMVSMGLLFVGFVLYLSSDLFWTMLKRNASFPRLFAALELYDAKRCPDCDDTNAEGACAKHAPGVPERVTSPSGKGNSDER